GNSATVEVMLAARASIPVSISEGSVRNEPPPASAFCAPAQIEATKRTMRAVMPCRGFALGGPGRLAAGRPPFARDHRSALRPPRADRGSTAAPHRSEAAAAGQRPRRSRLCPPYLVSGQPLLAAVG